VDQLGADRTRDGSVPVNAADAWLHNNIAGEAYVVSPACFEAFAAGRDLAPATVRHRVVRLRRHRQRESASGSANIFRAVLADGSRVKGMVFPGELVWDDDPPPPGERPADRQGPVTGPKPGAPARRPPAETSPTADRTPYAVPCAGRREDGAWPRRHVRERRGIVRPEAA